MSPTVTNRKCALLSNLPGYEDYRARVKTRFLPLIY